MPGELDGIAAVEAFKELGERVGTMGPKEENVFDAARGWVYRQWSEGNPVQGNP